MSYIIFKTKAGNTVRAQLESAQYFRFLKIVLEKFENKENVPCIPKIHLDYETPGLKNAIECANLKVQFDMAIERGEKSVEQEHAHQTPMTDKLMRMSKRELLDVCLLAKQFQFKELQDEVKFVVETRGGVPAFFTDKEYSDLFDQPPLAYLARVY